MYVTGEQSALLALIKHTNDHTECEQIPENVDWELFTQLAVQQGVLIIAADAALRRRINAPESIIAMWRKKLFLKAAVDEKILHAQDKVIERFDEAGIRSAILKGACSAFYYDRPERRAMGDIDILIPHENLGEACRILEEMGYYQFENEHEFHVIYQKKDISVEVHYAPSNAPDSEGGHAAKAFMSHFLDETQDLTVLGHTFHTLTRTNHAFMLLIHNERHLLQNGIGLRQLCDWAALVSKMRADEFDNELAPVFKACGLYRFALLLTKACSVYLNAAPQNWSDDHIIGDELLECFMDNIFRSGNMGRADNNGMRGMFSDRSNAGDGKKHNLAFRFLSKTAKIAKEKYPAAQKYPVLLPFLCAFLPVRYVVRMAFGLRPKKDMIGIISGAKKNDSLYSGLKLYDVQNTEKS